VHEDDQAGTERADDRVADLAAGGGDVPVGRDDVPVDVAIAEARQLGVDRGIDVSVRRPQQLERQRRAGPAEHLLGPQHLRLDLRGRERREVRVTPRMVEHEVAPRAWKPANWGFARTRIPTSKNVAGTRWARNVRSVWGR
jgi:hypothetical protein